MEKKAINFSSPPNTFAASLEEFAVVFSMNSHPEKGTWKDPGRRQTPLRALKYEKKK
ncbi:hypothetical protein AVEN_146274-1, partial [Araneus ventricosus]